MGVRQQPAVRMEPLGMTRSQLTSLSFELEGKANDVFSQTAPIMSIT